ncbi:MAG: 4'-phosphopantetheinyl transferase family protein [Muribaculaceae bacterium]
MPIINTPTALQHSQIKVAMWHITEDEPQLAAIYRSQCIDANVENVKLAKRRIEMMIEQLLLTHLLGKGAILMHHSNGSPFLKGSITNISISHTNHYVAIACSSTLNIGIDVQTIEQKILRVRNRFLSTAEQEFIADHSLEQNTLAWTAKEALYKAVGVDGVNFANHTSIDAQAIAQGRSTFICSYEDRSFTAQSLLSNNIAATLVYENKTTK